MKISLRVKRNISFSLMMLGVLCSLARGWDLAMNLTSGRAWFDFCGMLLLTYLCFDNFRDYCRRIRESSEK
ncbi:MAG: hypothetical protein HDT06_04455 [Bacteroidales bacterium]|nr:hypothetical protein [Bacteroidales bacterium]